MTFYCHPVCSTCKKARDFLNQRGIAYTELDIREHHPDASQLAELQQKSGLPLKRFFNTSGLAYKALNLSRELSAMSEDAQFELLASDGMLVKRPLLIAGNFVLLGFKEPEWEARI